MEVTVKQFKDSSSSMCLNGVGSSCQKENYSNVLIFTTALLFIALEKLLGSSTTWNILFFGLH